MDVCFIVECMLNGFIFFLISFEYYDLSKWSLAYPPSCVSFRISFAMVTFTTWADGATNGDEASQYVDGRLWSLFWKNVYKYISNGVVISFKVYYENFLVAYVVLKNYSM